ncbi:MAG: hypothetical protein COW00_05910 [Bdellovibrio sp. CG12_big_fil_rev_8_21_14_0_65_39_13]|nr:MAG: hypothetical protein COW78_18445 [Bdellovibrio sp. CG22_combo_CG10-13_8_21_14_all_39_27]PIQ60766.1 MAG: hypothetical protein COW00_05910 [Bdellovibrio sp. CG12_big_fil_rev_8_21_14_0_65_39_13]PIR36389.1 MAG: hypothetical protein COV37_03245 [Bdellovibrio sp. CG11_big_fil_rev_8_21_14_0_20_39_38]
MKYLLLFLLCASSAHAKLLDKIVIVFNDKVVTLSQLERVQKTMNARKEISPMIYSFKDDSLENISKALVESFTIREKLAELGFIVSDEQVEEQIKSTEKRLGLSRSALLQFLKSRNMTFDEYFEIIREAMEYNTFSSRIIEPLISVSDQQLKNEYYKRFKNDKSSSTIYSLIDYRVPKSIYKKLSKSRTSVETLISDWHKSSQKSKKLGTSTKNEINDLSDDGLDKKISRILKKTGTGKISPAVLLGNDYHFFLVVDKKVGESDNFSRSKGMLRSALASESAGSIKASWFESEYLKHYIRFF